MAGLILLLVFIAGYAVQRGSTCAVAAVDELVTRRRPARFLSFLFCAAVALAVLAAGSLAGDNRFAHYRGSDMVVAPIAGGALFGLGAWLNGRCAFGTIARLGAGEAARLATLVGLFVGFALAARLGIESPPPDLESPLTALPTAGILAIAVLAGAVIAAAMRSTPVGRGWSPLRAMGLIGLVNGSLLVIAAGWPYTNLLMDLATSSGMEIVWRSAMASIFVAGSLAGAVLSGVFRLESGSPALWTRALMGGTLMGIGATLVPGGNDTMLLVGMPLLLSNLVLAYAAMIAVLLLAFGMKRIAARPASILQDQAVPLGVAHAQIDEQ